MLPKKTLRALKLLNIVIAKDIELIDSHANITRDKVEAYRTMALRSYIHNLSTLVSPMRMFDKTIGILLKELDDLKEDNDQSMAIDIIEARIAILREMQTEYNKG